ncbi:MAG: hypothetical protein L6R40_004023 [Gallowayella cf. fulva]|nr:MAG: hypothetical protein L6R40_004023 [Xanthomendoza cf. fulva]
MSHSLTITISTTTHAPHPKSPPHILTNDNNTITTLSPIHPTPRAADAILTFLHNGSPARLKDFLDLHRVYSISISRFSTFSSPPHQNLCIERSGPHVTCYTTPPSSPSSAAHLLLNFSISSTGHWKPVGGFRFGKLPRAGDGGRRAFWDEIGAEFAVGVMEGRMWERGEGVEFEVEVVRFKDLPASAAIGHPHIVADFNEEIDKENLRAADGIATFLYRFKRSVLDDFLDMSIPTVEVIRREKSSLRYDMVVARNERECGFIRNGEFIDTQLSFGVKEDGSWTPLSGWSSGIYPQGPNKKVHLDEFGKSFAAQIMYNSAWDESTDKEIEVTTDRTSPEDYDH